VISAIDDFLLAAATRFSHRLQRLTGLTCYSIARAGNGMVAIASLLAMANAVHRFLALPENASVWIFGPALLLISVYRANVIRRCEEALWSMSCAKPSVLLHYRYERPVWRLVWPIMAIVNVALAYCEPRSRAIDILFAFAGAGGFGIFHYFVIVDPLPPGRGKVREWLASIFARPEVAASGA
jgi:hypothetical protein